ncbi:sulfatase [Seonamhaeicola maritimus]|uniref:sulfatase n=1 Tax=Seonamhaeicola maritimus TaxID=2591822 RepID=UPI00249466EB|nr:sulfatase [Seonamhaeicola maritimus]
MKIDQIKRIACILIFTFLSISCKENKSKNSSIGSEKSIQPNIVLIMADDLGYGELSCYGSKKINTPNIDALAAGGMKLTDFHSNGPVCSPTRAALITGKYQQRTGVEGVITAKSHREVGLSLEEITIAEALVKQGYHTGMFGKWHMGYAEEYNPIHQGFNEFVGFVSGNVDYHSHVDQEGYLDWWKGNKVDDEKGYTTDLITNYGAEFIKRNNSEKTGKPFFLYLSQEAPHYPIQGRHDKPVRKVGSGKFIRKVPKDSVQTIYSEMIETMDEGIGQVIQTLKDEGLYENTIIVFCSDNGAAGSRGDNGVLRAAKASVYEGGHRVPGIISYPNKIKAGTVNGTTIMSMDFLPTFVDLAGGKTDIENLDGISFKNMLVNEESLPERDLFWSFKGRTAMRSGKWKLVTFIKDEQEVAQLFDLEADLSEKNDLSDSAPERVKDMQDKIEKWKNDVWDGVVPVAN